MKLYRIRRKDTGKYFTSGSYTLRNFKFGWTATGVFYRKIDTIKQHLEKLQYTWTMEIKHHEHGFGYHMKKLKKHPERMDILEVVINDVTINGEETISAKDLMNDRPKRNKR